MKNTTVWLAGALGLQLMLALALTFGGDDDGAYTATRPLVQIAPAEVSKIQIAAGDGAALTLALTGEGWAAPDRGDLPVRGEMVDTLIADLAAVKRGWPVARTRGGADRLKVADDDFERRITFFVGDEASDTLLLGASPTFRRIYARRSGEADVYNIGFTAADAPASLARWTDPDLLAVQPSEVDEITVTPREGAPITLIKHDETFVLSDLDESEMMNGAAALRASRQALSSGYDAVEASDAEDLDESGALFTVTLKAGGATWKRLYFPAAAQSEELLFVVSERPQVFRIAQSRVSALAELSRADLLQDAPDETAAQAQPAAAADAGASAEGDAAQTD